MALHRKRIEELRRVWRQAIDDPSPGVDADGLPGRLKRKYEAILGVARM